MDPKNRCKETHSCRVFLVPLARVAKTNLVFFDL